MGCMSPGWSLQYLLPADGCTCCPSTTPTCQVFIETVDSFQGKQLDVVILSCVRASTGGGLGERRALRGVGSLSPVFLWKGKCARRCGMILQWLLPFCRTLPTACLTPPPPPCLPSSPRLCERHSADERGHHARQACAVGAGFHRHAACQPRVGGPHRVSAVGVLGMHKRAGPKGAAGFPVCAQWMMAARMQLRYNACSRSGTS